MIELTLKEYEKQRKKGNRTNEGYIYSPPQNKKKIIKVIEPISTMPKYLEIKKYTIELLLQNKLYLKELNIAIPEEAVAIESVQRGYQATKIKGIELECALLHPNIKLETKIDYFKQIGAILRKMKNLRQQHSELFNLFYNDIHERNFMVTPEDKVYGIDFDSCSIKDNIPIRAMYPSNLPKIKRLYQKYEQCNPVCEYSTDIVPSENLDLYSYVIMILNFMTGRPLYTKWNPDKLNNYLNFLESKGTNLELLYILSYIFDEKENNINPDYLLDYLKETYQYSCIRLDETGILRRILK